MANRRALGQGLSELFGGSMQSINNNTLGANDMRYSTARDSRCANQVLDLDLSEIKPCSTQPRTVFNRDALDELAESIRENGVLQPIIVRKEGNHYEIIAGERRWRASKLADRKDIPVIIKEVDDHGAFLMSVIENLQRSNLSSLEESVVYQRLMFEGYTQDQIAVMVNKSRSYIANMSRLTNLTPDVKKLMEEGLLSVGHAKVLLSNDVNAELQNKLADEIITKSLNIRQTEDLMRSILSKSSTPPQSSDSKVDSEAKSLTIKGHTNHDLKEIEDLLREGLSTEVSVNQKQIIVGYKDMVDLDRLLGLLLK